MPRLRAAKVQKLNSTRSIEELARAREGKVFIIKCAHFTSNLLTLVAVARSLFRCLCASDTQMDSAAFRAPGRIRARRVN